MIYLVFLLLFLVFQSSAGARFGDNCTYYDYCKDGSECIDSQCKCPQGQEFLSAIGTCGLKVGTNCSGISHPRCTYGSRCDEISQTCECLAPSKALPDGTCSALEGGGCSALHPCTPGRFLDCTNGECKCSSPLEMVTMDGECRAAPGGKCSTTLGSQFPTCVKNSECIHGVCQCIKGYGATLFGGCVRSYLQPCESIGNFECDWNNGLACKNGSCVCADSSLFWDTEKEACVAHLGALCDPTNILHKKFFHCADPNASCQPPGKSSSQRPICKCNPGFEQIEQVCVPTQTHSNCQCQQNNYLPI